jgi:hypothetical protein
MSPPAISRGNSSSTWNGYTGKSGSGADPEIRELLLMQHCIAALTWPIVKAALGPKEGQRRVASLHVLHNARSRAGVILSAKMMRGRVLTLTGKKADN